jgi:hypothetical protein
MNRKDIEHMWKVASNDPNHDTNWHDPVVIRFAALVASAEREKCALRAEEFLTEPDPEWGGDFWNQAIEQVADAIRARGNI